MSHPDCNDGHTCQRPSGRPCVQSGCDEPAGTLWGRWWCPEHDQQRLDRIGAALTAIGMSFRGAAEPPV